MEIPQGARSTSRIIEVNGVRCVEKRYNYRKDPPKKKLSKERAFYEYYKGLNIIPQLVATQEPDTIVLTYAEGKRLIDWIQEDPGTLDIGAISRHYGKATTAFYQWPTPQDASAKEQEAQANIEGLSQSVDKAITKDKRYQVPEIVHSAQRLPQLLDLEGWWSAPMMCKYDWSAANMLVQGCRVSCIYDFDTAYMGSRLTFLGNILNSCLHLDWPAVRQGLAAQGLSMPQTHLLQIAGHFSMWQIALSSFDGSRFKWPNPTELSAKLVDLSTKAKME